MNTGPWTGVSMSPANTSWIVDTVVFVLLPGHPYPVTFTLLYLPLSPSPSHSASTAGSCLGTDIQGGDIFHNLHHRYFEELRHVARAHGQVVQHVARRPMEAQQIMKDRKRKTAEAKDTDAVVGD